MSEKSIEKIPFAVEINRMLELLAGQIYPSPFALLRENVQNSFDAILLRRQLGHSFEAQIDIYVETSKIVVLDNGIGMTKNDLQSHFWYAGSSSKNTPAARAAGVVGTFGIGAMANFGIAEDLFVTTESAITGERTKSIAKKSTLSVSNECIEFHREDSCGSPGTQIVAIMQSGKNIEIQQAKKYISEFVSFLPIMVNFNGENISQRPIEESVSSFSESWKFKEDNATLAEGLSANIELSVAGTGDIRVDLSLFKSNGKMISGRMILKQGVSVINTLRSGFGLAATSLSSFYQLGGIADFLFFKPTAGREVLETSSVESLQRIVSKIEDFISLILATRPESNQNNSFIRWVNNKSRYDLCDNLRIRVEPGDSATLQEIKINSNDANKNLVYTGVDPEKIKLASKDRPLIMVSRSSPRRDCELAYLNKYCKIELLPDTPIVTDLKPSSGYTLEENGLVFKINSILSTDYFLESKIMLGKISHNIPILITKYEAPVEVCIDPQGKSVSQILNVYSREFIAFGHMVKDFVRTSLFPLVKNIVPSATRQGAEAFLKNVQKNKEIFEYETTDLQNLASLWKDYLEGKISMPEASRRANYIGARSYQFIDSTTSARVRDVVPDIITNEAAIGSSSDSPENSRFEASPSIQRLDMETESKILTIPDNEEPLRGFRAFLAIPDAVRDDKSHFFLQPHRTSVVWGGQKALFIFEHHSGEFGLYYDIQISDLIGNNSGGGSFETCTIVMKNRIFIPLPDEIKISFIPKSKEKKRLEIRCDILHIER